MFDSRINLIKLQAQPWDLEFFDEYFDAISIGILELFALAFSWYVSVLCQKVDFLLFLANSGLKMKITFCAMSTSS